MNIKLAIDAMGGDDAPDIVIGGVALACQKYSNVTFLLYGDEAQVNPLLVKYRVDSSRVQVIHASQVITGDMKPSAALRGSKDSSMRLAIEAVAEGRADAVVSAGNTGAYMALSKMILKTLKGIDRPAIASPLPTLSDYSVMLDLGANVDCTAENLVQFALMGQIYAQEVMGKKNPSLGLLNIGVEDLKGNTIIKETHTLLKEQPWVSNFVGFVEGNDVLTGKVDVIVTDGFTGNVSLKTAEGTFSMFKQFLMEQFNKNLWTRLSYLMARPVLRAFGRKFEPRNCNGAPFLGLDGISVKSHGGMDAVGFACAIGMAVDMVRRDVNRLIREGLEQWHADMEALQSQKATVEEVVVPLKRVAG